MVLVLTLTLAACVTWPRVERRRLRRRRHRRGAHDRAQAGRPGGRGPARRCARARLAPAPGAVGAVATLALLLVALAGWACSWRATRSGRSRGRGTGPPGASSSRGRRRPRCGRAILLLGTGWGGPRSSPAARARVAVWRRRSRTSCCGLPGARVLAAATIPWMDERFFVYLVPPAAVLLGRAIVGAANRARGQPLRAARRSPGGARAPGRGPRRSAWQGVLLSLPDTRALAGRWFGAHVAVDAGRDGGVLPARGQRVARGDLLRAATSAAGGAGGRGYAGDELPRARSVLDGGRSPSRRWGPSSGPCRRRSPSCGRSPSPRWASRIRRRGATRRARPAWPAPALFLPRPYDATWNGGVAMLDRWPLRPGRPHGLPRRGQVHDVVLGRAALPSTRSSCSSPTALEPSQVRVDVGWTRRRLALDAGDWQRRPLPAALVVAGPPGPLPGHGRLLPEGRTALVQIRAGAREIGEAYAAGAAGTPRCPTSSALWRRAPAMASSCSCSALRTASWAARGCPARRGAAPGGGARLDRRRPRARAARRAPRRGSRRSNG